jgi:hypothetical protein
MHVGLSLNPALIEPADQGRRPPNMRLALSIILRYAGFAFGLAAGGILLALMWPDVMGDLQNTKALRHIFGMFSFAIVLAWLVSWPFLRVADRLSPEGDSESADIGTST